MSLCFRVALALGAAALVFGQTGSVERIKVHGKSLEGNLEGDSPDRDVSIYLPASYKTAAQRRYPVVYMLHGFTDSDDKWFGAVKHWINLPAVLDKTFAGGKVREMIVVMPNAFTRFEGSMYSNSVTTGDWEQFIAGDLVAYIDAHYRTIATRDARGLAGHSMGGYGTLRIAMKRPEVFSSAYALSPCCLSAPDPNPQRRAPGASRAESVKDAAEVGKLDFMTKAQLASAAAWSPDPQKPPLFLDLPSRNGEPQPDIAAKWAANAPLAMLDQYIPAVRRLRAIALDAGAQDEPIATTVRDFDRALTANGVRHGFEIYQGDHLNRIAERIETKALPFFSENLATGNPRPR
jgi:S-formylglutathione hydrolase